ncbi:acetyl-CoA carboxylase carboxyltransferase subunit alpha [Amycolatopsis thailandensis]|uniref:acetyl-CoA carboxylase carboxyltransferase subunit alpha n=1 Tax=Amycolatopsis thailandensis TaxID=589330 RepID=UPI00364CF02B
MTLQATRSAREVETRRWIRCVHCGVTQYLPKLVRAQQVCPDCGGYGRLDGPERLARLLDPDSYSPLPRRIRSADPLGFTDVRPYAERLAKARGRTGLDDVVLAGTGTVRDVPVVIAVLDFRFLGGSMGSAAGEAVTVAAETALATGRPLVLVVASGGARMQEGCLSLMQMAKTGQALADLRRAGVGSVCVLTDPTFGGVTASFATLGDVLIAERGSLIGFAGPRVIEAATRSALPAGFQTAEYLYQRGMLDLVETREGLRPLLGRVLTLMTEGKPPHAEETGPPDPVRERPAAETLKLAREITRPTTVDYIGLLCDDFVELHGDRCGGDDPAIVAGLASLRGVRVMVIGHQRGHTTAELLERNFGMANPGGYRKALRLMKLAERLRLPVVTFVDTQGAAPGIEAEQGGQAWAIAEAIAGMSELTVPVVATVTGEGGSGGALAVAVANTVLMLENACYSVISPESCSTILYGSPSHAATMADRLRITAPELLRLGVIDAIVPEPEGGAQAAPREAAEAVGTAILGALAEFTTFGPEELRAHRHARFRRMGEVADAG